jgi:hypothetical protein
MNKYGEEAEAAIKAELSLMLQYHVFHPVKKPKSAVIPSSMFLKEKYDHEGKLKAIRARLVAGGHREIVDRSMSKFAPTVKTTTYMLMLQLAASDAHNSTEVWDVKSAFLNAAIDRDDLYMRLHSDMAAIMVKLKPEWKTYLDERGSLVVKLQRALYGTVEAARLWYAHIAHTLEKHGLRKNAHDECLFTMEKGQKHLRVCVHVDDLLLTGNCPKLKAELRQTMIATYGQMSEQTGDKLKYLGMEVETDKSTITVTQVAYTESILNKFAVNKKADNPCGKQLLDPDKSTALNEEQKAIFHSGIAMLNYLSCHTRPDIPHFVPSN